MSEHVSTWAALHLALDALEEAEADPDALVDVLVSYAASHGGEQLWTRLDQALAPTSWRLPIEPAEIARMQRENDGAAMATAMMRRLAERIEARARAKNPQAAAQLDAFGARFQIRAEWVPDPAVARERAQARRGGG